MLFEIDHNRSKPAECFVAGQEFAKCHRRLRDLLLMCGIEYVRKHTWLCWIVGGAIFVRFGFVPTESLEEDKCKFFETAELRKRDDNAEEDSFLFASADRLRGQ